MTNVTWSTYSLLCIAASAQPNPCVQLGGPLISICKPELDAIEEVYPLDSETPITDEQVNEISGGANDMCCERAAPFAQAQCPCDQTLIPQLEQVGLDMTSVGLQSVFRYLSQACNFEPVTC